MESANCNRRVPDAEQSPQYFVTVKCEPVKVKEEPTETYRYNSVEEPEWGECGVSEAAAAEGSYAGHQVKDETFGPELVQQQEIISMQSTLNRSLEIWCKLEPAVGAGAASECTRTLSVGEPCSDTSHKQHYSSGDDRFVNSAETTNFQNVAKTQFRSETVTIHTSEKLTPHGCDICSKQFTQKQSLVRHMNLIHTNICGRKKSKTPKKYKCDLCNKCFATPGLLAAHKTVHTEAKPYSCDICNKSFGHSRSLTHHKHIHNQVKPYRCDVCQKRFAFKNYLTYHKLKHTGEKPNHCDICGKRFGKRSHLLDHLKLHTGDKLFSCSFCKKQFTQKSGLNNHILTHTGEKSYNCDICQKQFARKYNLTQHIRIHTGEKPFSCDFCMMNFTAKCALNKHRRTHTGEAVVALNVRSNLPGTMDGLAPKKIMQGRNSFVVFVR